MASKLKTTFLADDFGTWWSGRRWNWVPDGRKMDATTGRSQNNLSDIISTASRLPPPAPPSTPTEDHQSTSPHSSHPSPYFSLRPSAKGGVGAFARHAIPRSKALFHEIPLFQSTDAPDMIMEEFSKLSPADKENFLALHSYDALDDDNEVARIFRVNRFRTNNGLSGIFLIASRFNHACFPTATYRFNGCTGWMEFTTIQDIAEDQEITISYGQASCDLALNYGFLCDCGDCVPPKTIPRWKSKW